MKRITVLVSNDLTHDQRVRKVCDSLQDMGFEITLIGREFNHSEPLVRPYKTKRFRLFFNSGALFYAELNIRLLFYLLFAHTDVILSNDLDTLLPGFLISRWRKKTLVYDSHEYFTEAAGLTNRPFPKKVWLKIESWIFPKLKHVITVNKTIADIYSELYKVPVKIVRNIPMPAVGFAVTSREELGLPVADKVVLLQGAFLDVDRGCMEAVQAMEWVENTLLLVIGAGAEKAAAKDWIKNKTWADRVRFEDKMPYEKLRRFTATADLGLSLDKPVHLNYKYSLPNKLFDYLRAGVPVLTSDLPELRRIHQSFEIGLMIDNHEPKHIALKINEALNSDKYDTWKDNVKIASDHYSWTNEEKVLKEVYQNL